MTHSRSITRLSLLRVIRGLPRAYPVLSLRRCTTPTSSRLSNAFSPTRRFSAPAPPSTYETNTNLLHLIRSNRLPDARLLFDQMLQRDEVSYTTLISGYVRASNPHEALSLFSHLRTALPPDPSSLSLAVKACASAPALRRQGESLHSLTLKSGSHPSSVFVSTALLDLYSRSSSPSTALKVFDEMPIRNVVSYTAAITALVRAARYRDALRLFADMLTSTPYDSHTYAIALKACADAGLIDRGREIHAHAMKVGSDSASYVPNSLATMYCKCGHLRRGLVVFERMQSPDVVAWTSVISTYVQLGREEDAVKAFVRMLSCPPNCAPNEYTYAAVVAACAGLSRVAWGEQVHARVTHLGFASAMSVANAIVTMYSRSGRLASADAMFREMTSKDIVSWTSIISAYCQEDLVEDGCELFAEMRRSIGGPKANEFTLASLLSACAGAAVLGPGRQLHAHTLAAGMEGDAMVASALITMYSKCGSIEGAARVLEGIKYNDVVSWTAMVSGYAEHGLSCEAIKLFERMPSAGLRPDYVTFIGVLTACGHAGLVDLGRQCFATMRSKYGIGPGREHYGCMVDMLGRAGELEEAERMIEEMAPGMADEVVWTALLRACGARGDIERGKRATMRVLEMEPGCAGAHIAMSNMHAAKGSWTEAAKARMSMRAKGVRKEVGWSWVELAGATAVFASGERSHRRGEELYAMLELVGFEAKMAGDDPEPEDTVVELQKEEQPTNSHFALRGNSN